MGIINYINNAKKQNKTIYQYISEKVQEQKDEKERQKEINLCEELCKKYGLKFGNRIKSYARYKEEADLRNISLKDYIIIKGEEKLEKERIEKYHKEFCEKYNVSYTSEYSWGNYVKEAQKINITPEEYIIIKSKENQENIDLRNKIIELCQKYSFPCDKPSYFGGYIGAAIKVNLSLEEYFKIIRENLDKEEKSINDCKELCDKYNLPFINNSSYGNYKREAESRNMNLNDYLYLIKDKYKYKNINNLNNCKNNNKKFKEYQKILNKYNSNLNVRNILSQARRNNFNSGNDLVDIENFLIYKNNLNKIELDKENNLIKLIEKYELDKNKLKNYKSASTKLNIDFEEYLIKLRNKIDFNKKENDYYKNLLNKYNLNSKNISKLISIANRKNLSLEEYLEINYKLNKENKIYLNNIKDLINKYNVNIKPENVLSVARRNHFNTGDNLKDIENYLIKRNKKENLIREENKLFQKYNIDLNKRLYFKRESKKLNQTLEEYIINYIKIKEIQDERNNKVNLISKYGFNFRYLNYLEKNANKKNMTFEEYMGTFVWCDHCQQYEDPDFNSISNHWEEKDKNEFFIYRIWKDDHSEDVSFLESNIVGFDKLLDNKIHCGIYRWYIDSIPFYYGQSINILRRSHEHFINIVDSSEYWLNIYEEMKNNNYNNNNNNNININKIHILSIDFVECNENELDSLEKKLILRDKPMTQICTNDNKYDNIIPLNQRDFNLENLKDKYEERIKYY